MGRVGPKEPKETTLMDPFIHMFDLKFQTMVQALYLLR